MYFHHWILVLFALSSFCLQSFADNLEITIAELDPGVGQVIIGIFDSEDDFMITPVAFKYVEVNENPLFVNFENELSPGTYAASIIYDINSNDKLDKNIFGIPTEPFGFSNNPPIRRGPPTFDDASFNFKSNLAIEIILNK